MKALQWLATVMFVLAGIALLCAPANGQAGPAAKVPFVPARFTVTDAGTVGKPDVLLIPGLASSKSVWDAEAKLLAPNYRLHILQVDGFAGVPAGANATGEMLPEVVEELHEYIAHAGIKPVVVGHSLGGLWALPYYAVLFNPAATLETVKPMADAMKAQLLAVPADQYAAMQGPMMAAMAKSDAGRKAATDSGLASDRAVVTEAIYEDLLTDMRPELGKIETPTLVLYEYDASTKTPPAEAYEALVKDGYKAMPHVTLVRVEDSRHFIMYDQPAKLDEALEGWLK